MTAAQRRRRISAILSDLSKLSRNGWRDARQVDYLPLERELRELKEAAT